MPRKKLNIKETKAAKELKEEVKEEKEVKLDSPADVDLKLSGLDHSKCVEPKQYCCKTHKKRAEGKLTNRASKRANKEPKQVLFGVVSNGELKGVRKFDSMEDVLKSDAIPQEVREAISHIKGLDTGSARKAAKEQEDKEKSVFIATNRVIGECHKIYDIVRKKPMGGFYRRELIRHLNAIIAMSILEGVKYTSILKTKHHAFIGRFGDED